MRTDRASQGDAPSVLCQLHQGTHYQTPREGHRYQMPLPSISTSRSPSPPQTTEEPAVPIRHWECSLSHLFILLSPSFHRSSSLLYSAINCSVIKNVNVKKKIEFPLLCSGCMLPTVLNTSVFFHFGVCLNYFSRLCFYPSTE